MSTRSYNPSAPAGSEGSNIIVPVYERGQNAGVKYRGKFYTTKQFNDQVLRRSATKDNTDAKRSDELKALNLIPFEALDKAQQYANAGDTMPIVFCKRENDAGGVWISPPLLDSSSDNFVQTFVYLISHGQTSISTNTGDYFFGKQCLADTGIVSGITFNVAHTSNPAVCPISGYAVSCDHTNFNFLSDPLSATVGEFTQIRTVNRYATGVTIRVKPLYPEGSSPPTAMERYSLTVYRTDNSTGTTTTVGGTFLTDALGGITSVSDTMSAGNYTYTIENTSVFAASSTKPDTILVEFRQSNTFPSSYDRTSSYTNIQLLGAEANLYDITKEFSPPGELKQLHLFMRDGLYVTKIRLATNDVTAALTTTVGSSNCFADLLWYWFKESGKFQNQNFAWISSRYIAICALFNSNYNITYNAYLTSSTSFMSYAQTVAPMLLCSLTNAYSIYSLRPLLPITNAGYIESGPLTVAISFTDSDPNPDALGGSIIAGTYSKQYKRGEDSLPINVVVTWRGQDNFNLETSQTTTVRYSDYAADSPEEAYDMSEFCTNAGHATIFAKYVLATRRYSTHTISFQTGRNVEYDASLNPMDVISLSLTRTNSAGDSRVETDYYLVDSLEFDQTGVVNVTATHFPVDGSGASIISNSILSGSFEVTT